MKRQFIIIILLPFLLSCTQSKYEEYFCETPFVDDNHFYAQQILKLSSNEFCVTWKGDNLTCAKGGEIIFDKKEEAQGYKGFVEQQNSYVAIINKDRALFNVYEKLTPKVSTKINRKVIGDAYHFIFKDTELGITLPIKNASKENLRTFDLYAISNFVFWDGRMINCSYLEEDGSCKDVNTYSIGGKAFESYYRSANNRLSFQYELDLNSHSLVAQSFDNLVPPQKYICEIWKKRRWWNF